MALDIETLRRQLCDTLRPLVRDVFADEVQVAAKGQSGLDLVTTLDFALQRRLEETLTALLPGTHVTGEEGYAGVVGSSAPVWLVDPLDGTVNFVAGLPSYAVAVALTHEGRSLLSAVYDIPHGVIYSASSGGGAFRDGQPLRHEETAARLAVLSSGLLSDLGANSPETLTTFLDRFKLRNLGCQALHLCHAAAGHLALVASREAKGWDDVAGALIAAETGLCYGHYAGADHAVDADQYSLCTTPELFDEHAEAFARSRG